MMLEKSRRYESAKLRKAAKDRACVSCGAQDGTVVLAHMPIAGVADAGMGGKCGDHWAAHLCARCHSDADSGPYRRDIHWRARMVYRTLNRLFSDGVVK